MSKGRIAGARGTAATPMPNYQRIAHYRRQNGCERLTAAQRRRVRRRARKARGNGDGDE